MNIKNMVEDKTPMLISFMYLFFLTVIFGLNKLHIAHRLSQVFFLKLRNFKRYKKKPKLLSRITERTSE